MYISVHATAGLLIGQQLTSPLIAFFAGILSHYLLDFAPHGDGLNGDKPLKQIIYLFFIDSVVMLSFGFWLYSQNYLQFTWPIIFAIIGTILPDTLWGITKLVNIPWLKQINRFHHYIHHYLPDTSPSAGILLQIVLLWASALFLIWK